MIPPQFHQLLVASPVFLLIPCAIKPKVVSHHPLPPPSILSQSSPLSPLPTSNSVTHHYQYHHHSSHKYPYPKLGSFTTPPSPPLGSDDRMINKMLALRELTHLQHDHHHHHYQHHYSHHRHHHQYHLLHKGHHHHCPHNHIIVTTALTPIPLIPTWHSQAT